MTNPEASDNRRATALVCHFGRQNSEGVNAVLAETIEANRVTPLIISVLDLHAGIVPILVTPDGLACITQMIHSRANDQYVDQECARAARLIISHSARDTAGFNTALREAADAGHVTDLLMATLETFLAVVPQLYCELGLAVLERSILDWAAREDATE